ncbi:MAG: UPF0149 family protein [Pseudomonadota bacterium]
MAENYGSDFLLMEQLLSQFSVETDAPEADGRLSGLAAMLSMDAVEVWLGELIASGQPTDALTQERAEPLRVLGRKRIAVLEAADSLPMLCLPDDDDDIRDRVDGLVHWSAGFLSGLAEGAALVGPMAREQLEAEPLAEMLKDLAEITQASLTEDELHDDLEQSEVAYAELVEFLRIACQLAYENLSALRHPTNDGPATVH